MQFANPLIPILELDAGKNHQLKAAAAPEARESWSSECPQQNRVTGRLAALGLSPTAQRKRSETERQTSPPPKDKRTDGLQRSLTAFRDPPPPRTWSSVPKLRETLPSSSKITLIKAKDGEGERAHPSALLPPADSHRPLASAAGTGRGSSSSPAWRRAALPPPGAATRLEGPGGGRWERRYERSGLPGALWPGGANGRAGPRATGTAPACAQQRGRGAMGVWPPPRRRCPGGRSARLTHRFPFLLQPGHLLHRTPSPGTGALVGSHVCARVGLCWGGKLHDGRTAGFHLCHGCMRAGEAQEGGLDSIFVISSYSRGFSAFMSTQRRCLLHVPWLAPLISWEQHISAMTSRFFLFFIGPFIIWLVGLCISASLCKSDNIMCNSCYKLKYYRPSCPRDSMS